MDVSYKVGISHFSVFGYFVFADGEDGAGFFYVFICRSGFPYAVGSKAAKLI